MRSIDPAGPRDEDLLRRVGAGDEQAFRDLFGRYAAAAARPRVPLGPPGAGGGGDRPGGVPRRLEEPGPVRRRSGSVRSWLMGTVHHRAVDAVRREQAQRRRAEQAAGLGPGVVEDPIDDVLAAIDLPRERKLVRSALGELPDEQREVIERMYFDGLSQSQIAERTGLPLGTVKSARCSRCAGCAPPSGRTRDDPRPRVDRRTPRRPCPRRAGRPRCGRLGARARHARRLRRVPPPRDPTRGGRRHARLRAGSASGERRDG